MPTLKNSNETFWMIFIHCVLSYQLKLIQDKRKYYGIWCKCSFLNIWFFALSCIEWMRNCCFPFVWNALSLLTLVFISSFSPAELLRQRKKLEARRPNKLGLTDGQKHLLSKLQIKHLSIVQSMWNKFWVGFQSSEKLGEVR